MPSKAHPVRRITLAAAALVLLACGDSPTVGVPQGLLSIVVTPKQASANEGDTLRFTAIQTWAQPAPSTPDTVRWQSMDPQHLAIDSNGVAVAAVVGSSIPDTIRVIATAGTKADTATVTIAPWSSIGIAPDTNGLFVGMTRQLVPSRTGRNGGYYVITTPPAGSWTSSDPGVATVNDAGLVTAVAAGHTTIQANLLVNGQTLSRSASVEVVPSPARQYSVAGGGVFETAHVAVDHSCALGAADRKLYCWGRSMPLEARPFDRCTYIEDAAGAFNTLMIVHCATFPALLIDTVTFTALSVGRSGGCAIPTTTGIYCWGLNDAGQLASGTLDPYVLVSWVDHGPVKILPNDQFRSVSAAGQLQCAIRIDGAGFCWGAGSTTVRPLGTQKWLTLAEGGTCGLASDSTAYCWTSAAALAPQQVGAGLRFTAVAVGGAFGCGLAGSGSLSCWTFDANGAPLTASVVSGPSLVSIGTELNWGVCGLTTSGDLYCVRTGGGVTSLQPLNRGVQLKRFSGGCGIGLDDKVYCWNGQSGQTVLVPGQ